MTTKQATSAIFAEALEPRRLLSAGDLDPTFGTGGVLPLPAPIALTPAAAQLPDGRYYVTLAAAGGAAPEISRLTADFTTDATFTGDGTVTLPTIQRVAAIELRPDGGLLIAGDVTRVIFPAEPQFGDPQVVDYDRYLIQLNPDGSLDTGFGNGAVLKVEDLFPDPDDQGDVLDVRITDVLLQADGKIVFVGGDGTIHRVTVAGAADTSFGGDGAVRVEFPTEGPPDGTGDILPLGVALDAEGRLVVAGATSGGVAFNQFAVARLATDGSLDPAFSDDGLFIIDDVRGVAQAVLVLGDGDVMIGGTYGDPSRAVENVLTLIRFNEDGSIDDNFFRFGGPILDTPVLFGVGQLVRQTDGAFLVKGGANIVRFEADGTFDQSFGHVLAPSGPLFLEPGGRAIVFNDVNVFGYNTADLPGAGPVSLPDEDGNVTVTGTAERDRVSVLLASETLIIRRNGFGRALFRGPVKGLSVDLGAGNDIFELKQQGLLLPMTVSGGAGSDVIVTAGGADVVSGGDGDDVIYTSAGNDLVDGGDGRDALGDIDPNVNSYFTIIPDDGDDTMNGGAGNDVLFGRDGDDLLSGGDGDDKLLGEGGNDTLGGNAQSDTLFGGLGADRLAGNGGRDWLFGNGGNDRLFGGASGDWLYGQGGDDQLFGEGGDDRLYGDDAGNDTLHGNAGNDLLVGRGDGFIDQLFGDGGTDSAIADELDELTSIELQG